MKTKGKKTAAELMTELEADPAFREARAQRETEHAVRVDAYRRAAEPVMQDLQAIGIPVTSVDDLLRSWVPLSNEIAHVLLGHLAVSSFEPLQESLVRALAAAQPFPGRILVDLFEATPSENLKWVIANTMAMARPLGTSDWLLKAAAAPSSGKAREMLVLAVARLVPAAPAKALLRTLFDDLPGHVAMAFAEVGGREELVLLKAKRDRMKGWIKKEIDKAIRAIEKRDGSR